MLGPRCKERYREREDGAKALEAVRQEEARLQRKRQGYRGGGGREVAVLQTGVLECQVFEQARHSQREAAARNGAMATGSERIVLQEVACRWETTR
jgi:hypothetical protein